MHTNAVIIIMVCICVLILIPSVACSCIIIRKKGLRRKSTLIAARARAEKHQIQLCLHGTVIL